MANTIEQRIHLAQIPPPPTLKACHERIEKLREKNKKRLVILLSAMSVSLLVGTVGYKLLSRMSFTEAFLNASMILSGMGPVDDLAEHNGAKIFASFFALFSGAFYLVVFAFIIQSILLTIIETSRLQEECPPASLQ